MKITIEIGLDLSHEPDPEDQVAVAQVLVDIIESVAGLHSAVVDFDAKLEPARS